MFTRGSFTLVGVSNKMMLRYKDIAEFLHFLFLMAVPGQSTVVQQVERRTGCLTAPCRLLRDTSREILANNWVQSTHEGQRRPWGLLWCKKKAGVTVSEAEPGPPLT